MIMRKANVNRGLWDVIIRPCNVIMGPCNVIMGQRNVNRGPRNVLSDCGK